MGIGERLLKAQPVTEILAGSGGKQITYTGRDLLDMLTSLIALTTDADLRPATDEERKTVGDLMSPPDDGLAAAEAEPKRAKTSGGDDDNDESAESKGELERVAGTEAGDGAMGARKGKRPRKVALRQSGQ